MKNRFKDFKYGEIEKDKICPYCKEKKVVETIHGHGRGLDKDFKLSELPEGTQPAGFGSSSYKCLNCEKNHRYVVQFYLKKNFSFKEDDYAKELNCINKTVLEKQYWRKNGQHPKPLSLFSIKEKQK